MKLSSIAFAASAALLTIMGFSSPAYAATPSVYPGSNCDAYYGSQDSSFIHGYASFVNNSDSTLWANCPIPTNGEGWPYVTVSVKRASGTPTEIDCYVALRNYDGAHIRKRSISWGSNGWDGAPLRGTVSAAKGGTFYQNLYCKLPPKSEILWYATHRDASEHTER